MRELHGYAVHPAADAFPMMPDAELQELADDIKTHGLQMPITLTDGGILVDGRNRLEACTRAGAEVEYECLPADYTEKQILDYAVSANVRRRQLTPGQKAAAAAKLEPLYAEAAKKRKLAALKQNQATDVASSPRRVKGDESGKAREQAAKAVGASGRSVSDFKAINRDAPDLAKKVSEGEMTINAAAKEARKRTGKEPPARPTPQPPDYPEGYEEVRDLYREGLTQRQICEQLDMKPHWVRRLVERAQYEEAGASKAVAIEWDSIPASAKEKLEAARRQIRRELEAEFEPRIEERVQQGIRDRLEAFAKEHRETRRRIERIESASGKGIFTKPQFQALVKVLHADRHGDGCNLPHDELNAALDLLNKAKDILLKEAPKLSTLPSIDELMERRMRKQRGA